MAFRDEACSSIGQILTNAFPPQLQKSLRTNQKLYDVNFDPQRQSARDLPTKSQGLISQGPKPKVSCEQSIHALTGP